MHRSPTFISVHVCRQKRRKRESIHHVNKAQDLLDRQKDLYQPLLFVELWIFLLFAQNTMTPVDKTSLTAADNDTQHLCFCYRRHLLESFPVAQ